MTVIGKKKGIIEAVKMASLNLVDEVKVLSMELIRRTNRAELLVMTFL
jgi:hypothetical protein